MNERVLLADDAPFMRLLQKDALKKYGFEICGEAADGFEAVVKYEELQPDVLILGIIFPKIDGIEVLKKIKKEYPEAKIIICSSLSHEQSVVDALRYGADNFVVKPFQPEFFVNAVKTAIANRRMAALLNQNMLSDWHVKQKNYKQNEHLSQEQINIIVESYWQLYPVVSAPAESSSKDDLLKNLEKLAENKEMRDALSALLNKFDK